MIALFGGTFNPVHNGHVALARQVAESFGLKQVQFVPSHVPVHRDEPQVDASARARMVQLAIQPYPELSLNDIELERGGASYSVDTLTQIHRQNSSETLCWLMGVDAFNGFESWKNPAGILQLAHLIVCSRPGEKLLASRFAAHYLDDADRLERYKAGKIVRYEMQPNACSSTDIRTRLKAGHPVSECMSQPVLEFIQQNNLYET